MASRVLEALEWRGFSVRWLRDGSLDDVAMMMMMMATMVDKCLVTRFGKHWII